MCGTGTQPGCDVMPSGVGHLAEVVSGDVAPLAVGLSEPPVFVSPEVRELQDADMLVLLQTELLLAACHKCVHSVELRKHTHAYKTCRLLSV